MLQAIYRTITVMIFFCTSISAFSQNFYINAWKNPYQTENLTYEFTVGKCDIPKDSLDMRIPSCPATVQTNPNWPDSAYTDIAIDIHRNLWYVTLAGRLYYRKLGEPSPCKYVGTFLDTPATFSGLVADNKGTIYAAANRNDHCVLYKYDTTNGFKYLGMLPKWVQCSGDLFFYQRRLFMTCVGSRVDSYFLYEIALADPSQSCYYMPLPGITAPYAAFSYQEQNKHRVFISSTDTVNYSTSRLMEIDMQNKKVLGSVCSYLFQIRGAAAYYDRTGDTSHCPIVPNSVLATGSQDEQLTIYNPSGQTIRLNTNIKQQDIRIIELYDLYGKRVRQYSADNFPNNMAIADLPDGMYILHLAAKDGRQWKEKMVKSSGW